MTPALRPVRSLQCLPAAGSWTAELAVPCSQQLWRPLQLHREVKPGPGHLSISSGPWCQDHDVNRLAWDVDLPKELGPRVWPCPVQG